MTDEAPTQAQGASTGAPMTIDPIHPRSILQMWFALTQTLQEMPETIFTVAMFHGSIGIVVADWEQLDAIPAKVRETLARLTTQGDA
jgi:hypothetical protein